MLENHVGRTSFLLPYPVIVQSQTLPLQAETSQLWILSNPHSNDSSIEHLDDSPKDKLDRTPIL